MRRKLTILVPLAVCFATVIAAAQDTAALRREIERRFDVLPLQDGIALRPKSSARRVRSIEITERAIAIDGMTVTGAELRERLGDDADPIIRLSYLDPAAQKALFAPARAAEPPSRTIEPPATAVPPAERPEPPAPPPPSRNRRSSERVRFGGSITVDPDEIVTGDVAVIGGSGHIMGEVTGNVVVIGGVLELGPQAVVGGDVTVVGGRLRRNPSARVDGKVSEVGAGNLELERLPWRQWRRWPLGFGWWNSVWGAFFALMSTVIRLAVLCLLVCLVLLFGREYVERVSARAAAEPVKAGIVGVLAQLLFLPLLIVTIVVLVVTIIGIPLLALIPFAVLAFFLCFLVGFAAVSYEVGRFVTARFGWPSDNVYRTAIVGILAVISPVLLARLVGLAGGILFPITIILLMLGFLVEYFAWTVGLGAVALQRFHKPAAQS